MGFSSVYKSLQEIFPEVDARLLRAVAIEHPKDADQAVEVVLIEVLPYMSKQFSSSGSHSENKCSKDPSDGDEPAEEDTEPHDSLVRRLVPKSTSSEDASGANATGGANNAADSTSLSKNSFEHLVSDKVNELTSFGVSKESNDKLISFGITVETCDDVGLSHGANVDQEISVNTETNKLIAMDQSHEIAVERTANVATTISVVEDEDLGKLNNVYPEDFDLNIVPQINSCSGSSQPVLSSVEATPDAAEFGQPDSGSPVSDYKEGSCSFSSNEDRPKSSKVNVDDDSLLVSRSGQICEVNLLEGVIEDAKNNKETLFSAMESVINLMEEVEHQEEAAEKAKEEAAKGIDDILVKVEEIKKMLVHAKEANAMHAGEVYGEKAILATEVRELQARLLSLSVKRDASLAILNEMRGALESRLASAKEVIIAALWAKQEKEESAKYALAEQEAFLEKVVQESKMLQEEAEENSKLQEFLMDRGRVVDVLQGEISVICQDVKLMKERFDKCIPLSQSITSSQTSCKLASSSSTPLKRMASDLDTDQGLSKTSPTTSMINGESPKGAHLDDGWDFVFDDIKVSGFNSVLSSGLISYD